MQVIESLIAVAVAAGFAASAHAQGPTPPSPAAPVAHKFVKAPLPTAEERRAAWFEEREAGRAAKEKMRAYRLAATSPGPQCRQAREAMHEACRSPWPGTASAKPAATPAVPSAAPAVAQPAAQAQTLEQRQAAWATERDAIRAAREKRRAEKLSIRPDNPEACYQAREAAQKACPA